MVSDPASGNRAQAVREDGSLILARGKSGAGKVSAVQIFRCLGRQVSHCKRLLGLPTWNLKIQFLLK